MRRKHFYKRTKEPVDFSWTLFLVAALQVSVWSFGVWEQPFHQFIVNFQHNVKGERQPNSHLSYDKPPSGLAQQLLELCILNEALHSNALKLAEASSWKRTPKLDYRVSSDSAQELTYRLLESSEDDPDADGTTRLF